MSEAGSGSGVKQAVVLAGTDGSRDLCQQTTLSRDSDGGRRRGRQVRGDNLESLNGGVKLTQHAIGDKRCLALRWMNLGMLDDRESMRNVCHA